MESIFEKYVDDIRGLLPLHRILLFVFCLSVSVISDSSSLHALHSLLRSFLAHPLNPSGISRLVERAVIGDLVVAGVFTVVTWLAHRWISKKIISRIWARLKMDERMRREYEEFDRLTISEELRVAALGFANEEAKRRSSVSRSRSMLAELCLGIGICLIAYAIYGNALDAGVGSVLLAVALFFQVSSFLYYLRHVLPFELNASALSGFGRRLGTPEPT